MTSLAFLPRRPGPYFPTHAALRTELKALKAEAARLADLAAQAERDDRPDLLREYIDEFTDLSLDIYWHKQEIEWRRRPRHRAMERN